MQPCTRREWSKSNSSLTLASTLELAEAEQRSLDNWPDWLLQFGRETVVYPRLLIIRDDGRFYEGFILVLLGAIRVWK